ncbi:DUF5691 domain-containing protein [Bosea sp. (in: a-proteobacteria)]|uniref:DUF5691 domain-containing protein n=2 Tax=Bosea sp. (in: a-proteobacteria) TaxID=1871050 RepID=UPI0031FEDF4C
MERSTLAALRDCWMGGGAAFATAPAEWKQLAEAGEPDERERMVLAIAAQAFDVGLRPAAPKTLIRRPPLPTLALPTLPTELRPQFRTALKNVMDDRGRSRLLSLVAGRGYVAHPLDWMPAASDTLPPFVYAPWIDWRANDAAARKSGDEPLTADNWDEFYPAARRVALTALRNADPAAARALIEAKAASEAAEARLSIIELLRVRLSADDVPYLQSLSADRSGKVRELAARLLSRLGRQSARAEGDDPVAELAGFVEQGKAGFIRRRATFGPAKLTSNAQQARRAELFEQCSLTDLAATFGVGEKEFVDAWQFDADGGSSLVPMIANTASDDIIRDVAERLLSSGLSPALLTLLPRLDQAAIRGVATSALAGGLPGLHLLKSVDTLEPGRMNTDELLSSKAFEELLAALASTNEAEHRRAPDALEIFGFLADAAAARAIAGAAIAAGFPPADAALALLRLNMALAAPPPTDRPETRA